MEGATEKYDTKRSTCAQVVASLAFNCLMINVGLIICMPALIIGALRVDDSTLAFSEGQASWFGSLIFFVQPLGSVVSGFLQDHLGRKTCMMMVNIPQVVAWLMLYYATSVSTLFIAVIILGVSIGFMEAPVLSYIGEISEPRLRGVLSTLGGIFFNFGLMIEAFIGAATDWRSMVLYSSVSPVVAFIALSLVPDSPAWLVTKGRVEDARKAYQWLRGWVPPEEVKEELDTLIAYVNETSKARIVRGTDYHAVPTKDGSVGLNNMVAEQQDTEAPQESQLKIFLHPSVQRPLLLIVTYFFVSTCASLCAMRPFFIEVLHNMQLNVDPRLVMGYGTCLTMLGALTATLTMSTVGKRGLSFISMGVSVFCCYGLGVYLAMGVHTPWIPLTLFAISYYFVPLGIICVPWILISELYPLRGRGFAGGVSAAIGYFIIFLIIKTYYNVVSLIDVYGACILYGSIGAAGFIYLYYHLPETEGVPLEDIEGLFAKGKRKNSREATQESNDIPEERNQKAERKNKSGEAKLEV